MKQEHGVHVDDDGFVWITGAHPDDGSLLKFTAEGQFVLQIGRDGPRISPDSNDTTRLGGAAGIAVDTKAREVFVADGYYNRRVIVFDSITGAYKRHWGAYGRKPVDADRTGPVHSQGLDAHEGQVSPASVGATPSPSFSLVHCITRGANGTLYVCDRANNRVQVFRSDGLFIREFVVEPMTGGMGSVWALALLRKDGREYLLNADGTNNEVRVLDPASGKVLNRFGRQGRMAGEFHWVHGLAVDSAGSIYTGEVQTGKRLQRFTLVPDSAALRAGVAEAVERLRLALLEPQEQALAALVDDALSYGHVGGKVEGKRAFIEAALANRGAFSELAFSDQSISVAGDTAIVRNIFDAVGTRNGISSHIRSRVVMIWRLQAAQWRLLARQGYRLPEHASAASPK